MRRRDRTSIGSILERIAGVTSEQMERALRYKADHDDILLGEAMVRLGFVTRRKLEAAVAIQQAKAKGGASSVLQLAIDRTHSSSARAVAQVAVGLALVDKMSM